jgi:hypothetical protein
LSGLNIEVAVGRICFGTACNFIGLVKINYLIIRSNTFDFNTGHYLPSDFKLTNSDPKFTISSHSDTIDLALKHYFDKS